MDVERGLPRTPQTPIHTFFFCYSVYRLDKEIDVQRGSFRQTLKN